MPGCRWTSARLVPAWLGYMSSPRVQPPSCPGSSAGGDGERSSVRDDDRAPVERTFAQPLVGLADAIKGEALHVSADDALTGELEHLHELDRRSPVRDAERGVERYRAELVPQDATGEPDD